MLFFLEKRFIKIALSLILVEGIGATYYSLATTSYFIKFEKYLYIVYHPDVLNAKPALPG